MTNLRRYFFWFALYLALIFALGQADYTGRPVINFASYFYLMALIGVPATLFFPYVTRVSAAVPMSIWAVLYFILPLVVNRTHTTTSNDLSVMILEFLLLELGVWLAYQLAQQITKAESVMDELALQAFPHRSEELDEGSHRVRTEFSRSRRYHRPLSLLLMEVDLDFHKEDGQVLKSIQYDIANRLTVARVGQIIDDRLRQTDMVLRDRRWCYVILCPETDLSAVLQLARRITESVKATTGLRMHWGAAAFPEEALTFDDLMTKARQRLTISDSAEAIPVYENRQKEISNI